MKKIIILTFSIAAVAFSNQSCNEPVDTAKEMEQVNALAKTTMMAYADSLKGVCMTNVMAMASYKADSMMKKAMGSKSTGKKSTPPAPPPAPTNAKSDKMSGNASSTEEKKDKMSNSQESSTQQKKDKMNKGTDPNPKF